MQDRQLPRRAGTLFQCSTAAVLLLSISTTSWGQSTTPSSTTAPSAPSAQPRPAQPQPAQPNAADPKPVEPNAPETKTTDSPATQEPTTTKAPEVQQPDDVSTEAVAATQPAVPTDGSPAPPSPKSPEAANSPAAQDDDYAGATDAALAPQKPPKRNFQFGILLDLSVPLGNTSQFVSKASIQGFSLDARYFFSTNLGMALSVGFDTLSEKSQGQIEWENVVVTSVNTRQVSFTPFTAKAIYALRDMEHFQPYAALGAGACHLSSQVLAGYSIFSESDWYFLIAPEVGLAAPVGKVTVVANTRLNYLPSTGEAPSQLLFNFSAGVAIQ